VNVAQQFAEGEGNIRESIDTCSQPA
jgi:hypothetical protein